MSHLTFANAFPFPNLHISPFFWQSQKPPKENINIFFFPLLFPLPFSNTIHQTWDNNSEMETGPARKSGGYTVSWVHPLKLCATQYQLVNGKLQGKTTPPHPRMLFTPWKVSRSLILDDGHGVPLQNGCLIYPEGVCVLGKERQSWALFSCFIALPQTCFSPNGDCSEFQGKKRKFRRRNSRCCWSEPAVVFHPQCVSGGSWGHFSLGYCLTGALRCIVLVSCKPISNMMKYG